jgi:Protein of unknown function (DUF3489)
MEGTLRKGPYEILVLLRRPEGAGLDVLVKETGWQKHSVRGFLAGTVRKKLKLPLVSEKIDGVRNYRIGTQDQQGQKKPDGTKGLIECRVARSKTPH